MTSEARTPKVNQKPSKAAKATGSWHGIPAPVRREANRNSILQKIRTHQPASRTELAELSGLQNSTISSIVEQLLAEGWITEGEVLHTARGRRPSQISLNLDRAILVAQMHPGSATLAIVNLNGRVLQTEQATLGKAGSEDLAAALRSLGLRHPELTFIGAGVCLPGNLDSTRDGIRLALTKHLRMPVELIGEAKACLVSGLWFGPLTRATNVVSLDISDHIGASILANGKLITGRLGLAGNLAHLCCDPSGPLCRCGKRGCWELFASSQAALRYYAELVPNRAVPDYSALAGLAAAGDRQACIVLKKQAEAIGRGLRIVTAALDPGIILFVGDISSSWPALQPMLEENCARGTLTGHLPRLLCTPVSERAALRGAAAFVLQHHPAYYLTRSAALHSSS